MGNPPTGTVTFLFTDIEGSTKLAQEYPDTWDAMRKRHDAIMRFAIELSNGYVFNIIGDAFCAAFHNAGDALQAAIKAQVDLYAENWGTIIIKARMGIHTGKAEIQDDGDYNSYATLSRIQRLMSAGYGGQTLISQATQDLIRDELPQGVTLRDMGEHRLKDLIHPEHIYQLNIPDLPNEFPALKTLDVRSNNLPAQTTPFVGREREIAAVLGLLRNPDVRLVTLTGAGGTGKTRLSLQVAADLLDEYEHGVWFVELASITNPELILPTIASILKVKESAGASIEQTLHEYLFKRNLLLVIDNFEQLVSAAPVIGKLLAAAPKVKVLTSSRERIYLRGEHDYPVPPLGLPESKHKQTAIVLAQYEATALFIQHARTANSAFELNEENAPIVAEICMKLDGLPLAIELAAARSRLLKPAVILEKLKNRLSILTGGARDLPQRQQTIRSAIDWSYNLLDDVEKALLTRLAVFAGGWTLEAAEAVCSGEGIESGNILDLLTRLTDKSLVEVHDQAETSRYRMLETIRQYALEKLIELGEHPNTCIKHLGFFIQLAESAENHLIGPDQVQWLNNLEREHDNFRTALKWSLKTGKHEEALRMAGALGLFWLKHSHFSEGRRWLENVLEGHQSISNQLQIKAWRWAGFMAFWQQDMVASHRIYTQNLKREQALEDQWGIAFSLHMLANIANLEGDVEKSRELHKKSITLSREIDAIWVMALAQYSLGDVEHFQGNLALAEELSQESLNHFRFLGEKFGMGLVLSNLGYIMCSRGNYSSAKKIFLEALDLSRELGNKDGIAIVINGLAGVFQNEKGYITSARLQGVVVSMEKEIGIMLSLYPVEQEMFDSTTRALKESLGAEAYQMEFETGMTLTLDEAVSLVSGRN